MIYNQGTQFTRTVFGLANPAPVQSTIQARYASSTHTRSFLPVRSQGSFSSLAVAIPATQPSTLLSSSSSMSRKTEGSILRHVERLQKGRPAQAACKAPSAFAKPAVSIPVPNRTVERPACRDQSAVSSVARRERAANSHIERITQARARRSPPPSARSTPAMSRTVSPVLPLPEKSVAFDLARVEEKLAQLAVAQQVVEKAKPKPLVPALVSCLKTRAATAVKKVRFEDYGGWNVHRVRAYTPGAPPNSFIPLKEADLIHPGWDPRYTISRTWGNLEDSPRRMILGTDRERRWPPADHTEPALRWSIRDHGPEYSRKVRERLSQPVI